MELNKAIANSEAGIKKAIADRVTKLEKEITDRLAEIEKKEAISMAKIKKAKEAKEDSLVEIKKEVNLDETDGDSLVEIAT